ncbi:MAG TPA: serine/threonine-protein kinase [Polyangiaceae bacterium]|nr:serine/threonine-protein kinase [Polyangiaceae bacterium]
MLREKRAGSDVWGTGLQTLRIHDGSRLGPYRLSRLLGRGATSAVYEAVDPAGRRTALKVFHVPLAFEARHAARFLREARVAKGVRHPHIVETLDFGEADGQTFLAMELMGGDTLASLLRRSRKLPLERALGLLLPIGSAVQALHEAGIVHRDIKPSNILLTAATPERAKLSDFGVSTLRGDPTLTRSEDVLGTPAYMAPELIVFGATAASERSDQYSLAATFYECVTGQRPFGSSSTYETMRSAVAGRVAPPSSIDASLPARLDDVLTRALRPTPDERFDSVSEFAAALEGLTEEARRERRLESILPTHDTSSAIRPTRQGPMVSKALSRVRPLPAPSVSSDVPTAVPVESHVGALIEIRFIGSATMDQVVTFEAKLVTLVRRVVQGGKRRAVLCTDLRLCQVLRPEVSDRIVQLMKNDNPHIVRNAFLAQSSALLSLQVARFISETGGQDRRRIFSDKEALVAWLSEVTTIPEQTQLRTFLDS